MIISVLTLLQAWRSSCTPLTVKQVLLAPRIHNDAPYMLYGRELSAIRCIGNVVSAEARDKLCMFDIEDGSAGRIKIVFFNKERKEEDPPDRDFERVVNYIKKGEMYCQYLFVMNKHLFRTFHFQ